MPTAMTDTEPFFEVKWGGRTIDRFIEYTSSLSARTTSREFRVWGINTPVTFTLGGAGSPAFRINSGPEVTTGTISAGDRVRIVATSAASAGQQVVATFSIGTSPTINYTVRTSNSAIVRRVFVTSTTRNGDLGGLSGAHSICATRAAAASLTGASTYRALISTGVTNGFDLIDWRVGRFETVTGVLLANHLGEILNNATFANPVRTETGALVSTSNVWTGVSTNGGTPLGPSNTASTATCSFFSSNIDTSFALTGIVSNSVSTFTTGGGLTCNLTARLYCYGPN
jgi:hypothetical protein